MKRIGRYPVVDALGRGLMAQVFLVRIPVINRPAALKRLAPHAHLVQLLGGDRLRALFLKEAVTLGRLQHAHICEVWDFGQDSNGQPFYLMGYHGHSLGVMIGEGPRIEAGTRPIRIDRALDYTLQTLEGLACLHDAGWVHRDIKPHNLLLTDEDAIKIGDFGLSKRRGERLGMPRQIKVGSPGYAAPEQAADPDAAGPQADLYAVGVLFYRLVTGQLPDTDAPPGPAPLRQWVAELDASWDRFVRRCLAADPAQRFDSAGQMAEALAELADRHRRALENACRLTGEPAALRSAIHPGDRPVRRSPQKVLARHAQTAFDLDVLWRPRRYWPADRFQPIGSRVHDPWNGRTWQQAGSPYPMDWTQARAYVDALNRQGFAGRHRWRLPTVPELATLLRPPLKGRDFCLEPCFAQTQRRLWSADRKSHRAAWLVSSDMGFITWQETLGRNWIRAVCDEA